MKKPEITLPEEQTPRAPRVLDPQQGGWGAEVGEKAQLLILERAGTARDGFISSCLCHRSKESLLM